jgi:hypothetical protein
MNKILELQSEIYIKMNSINENYRFIHFICSYTSKYQINKKKISKNFKKLFNNTMKILLWGVKMMSHYYTDNL